MLARSLNTGKHTDSISFVECFGCPRAAVRANYLSVEPPNGTPTDRHYISYHRARTIDRAPHTISVMPGTMDTRVSIANARKQTKSVYRSVEIGRHTITKCTRSQCTAQCTNCFVNTRKSVCADFGRDAVGRAIFVMCAVPGHLHFVWAHVVLVVLDDGRRNGPSIFADSSSVIGNGRVSVWQWQLSPAFDICY